MSYKRLTPCIFIAGGKAVRWFDDRTVLTEDVIALAKQYNANGADELLVFDLSDSDEDHEESIDLIKKINRIISIPMVAGLLTGMLIGMISAEVLKRTKNLRLKE